MPKTELPACSCGRDDLCRREALGLTQFENLVLDLTRCILDVHASGSGLSWLAASDLAEQVFGPSEGPLVVGRVTAYVRAVLTERTGCLQFLSPGCLHIADHERDLMKVVTLAFRGNGHGLRQAAEAVALGDTVPRILASAIALAAPRRALLQTDAGDRTPDGAPAGKSRIIWH